jgi:hypothetical protein
MRRPNNQIQYWQCPQDAGHVYDYDDWRVQPSDAEWLNVGKWFRAYCPKDGRELVKHQAEVGV